MFQSRVSILAVAALLVLAPVMAQAEKILSVDEVKALISGKTVHAHHVARDYDFKTYFSPDGTYITVRKGNTTQGTWKIQNDGYHCLVADGDSKCAEIADNGNGTYSRISNKKRIIDWKKIVDGKDL